jgi:two-component system sensor histidine kinase DctS
MSSVLDISEKKRAEQLAAKQQERLEASGRLVAVGEAASTLAHELNQPLGALSSFAHGLLNRLRSHSIAQDEIERVVQRMARLSDKAGGIIQRVNAFARRRELVLAPVQLARFVQRCIASHPRADTVRVDWSGTQENVWVQADELLLEHVVNNLLSNACAWSIRNGKPARIRVSLACARSERMASISVADNGPGVAEADREQIFNAFFSTQEGGMGMGLAICRSIVEAHHGRIEVGSDPELGGARFTVWLPLVPAAPAEKGEAP